MVKEIIKPVPPDYYNPVKLLSKLKSKPEKYWTKRGEQRALSLFHLMAKRVPAYADFLKKNRIKHSHIQTIRDFKNIPPIDKDNYLRAYPLPSLCWDGNLGHTRSVISATSGSTGKPFYFPRQKAQDWQYAILAELYLRTNFQIHKKSTLYINAFPMGIWIGGVFTYDAVKLLSERGDYNLSIVTPGIHKAEVIQAVKELSPHFDQTIIGSYGPFLKDILDDGVANGIRWQDYNCNFIFSAEMFTEGFRDYVIRKSGVDPLKGTLNHYGTVDLGTMSHETPLSIFIRKQAIRNKKLYRSLFGNTVKLPTLTQYIPDLFYFESEQNNLLCSAFSGLPLVRYDLKDTGEVLPFEEMKKRYNESMGSDLLHDAKKSAIADTVWHLPFVHVFERNDFSVSFHAFQIYPETLRRALQKKDLEKAITGKFTMAVKFDTKRNQYIEINIELKAHNTATKKLEKTISDAVVSQLLLESSEYRETYSHKGELVRPKIVFWPYESPMYFKPGVKQRWVQKK